MKTRTLAALVVVLSVAHARFPDIVAPLRTGQKAPKDAAIIISLETYPFLRQGVPYAYRDGDAMEHLLLYTYGVGPRRVFRVRAGDRDHLLKQVRQATQAVKPGGTLWFYFAGHGANRSGQHYLVADDARDKVGYFFEKSVSEAEIKAALAGSQAAQVVYIEDSCFGATEALRTAGPADPIRRPKMIHLSATSSGAMAKPLREAKHGAFTYMLVGALRGWADGEFDDRRDGRVTLDEAKQYVQRELSGLGVEQQPVFVADAETDQVLSHAKEATPRLRAAPRPRPATDYAGVDKALAGVAAPTPTDDNARAAAQVAHREKLDGQWTVVRERLKAGRDSGTQALRVFLDAYRDHPLGNPHGSEGRALLALLEDTATHWVQLKGKAYMMGSTGGDDDERPVRRVTVRDLAIAKHEVTVAQFRACVSAGACAEPEAPHDNCNWPHSDRARHPMNCVDWAEAKAYTRWIGARLPSEAEWEFAARSGGKAIEYPWGDEEATCDRAVRDGCGHESTAAVCSRPAGHSAQGACDLAGNVWEWVEDWYGPYGEAPTNGDPRLTASQYRVGRGGGFGSFARSLRAAYRDGFAPTRRNTDLGFRPARSAP